MRRPGGLETGLFNVIGQFLGIVFHGDPRDPGDKFFSVLNYLVHQPEQAF
jgi:hypothetical protein